MKRCWRREEVQESQGPEVLGSQGPRYLKVTLKYELDSKEGPSCSTLCASTVYAILGKSLFGYFKNTLTPTAMHTCTMSLDEIISVNTNKRLLFGSKAAQVLLRRHSILFYRYIYNKRLPPF